MQAPAVARVLGEGEPEDRPELLRCILVEAGSDLHVHFGKPAAEVAQGDSARRRQRRRGRPDDPHLNSRRRAFRRSCWILRCTSVITCKEESANEPPEWARARGRDKKRVPTWRTPRLASAWTWRASLETWPRVSAACFPISSTVRLQSDDSGGERPSLRQGRPVEEIRGGKR